MTATQKIIIIAVVGGCLIVGVYQARQVSDLRAQVQALKQQQEQQAALADQARGLERERDRARNELAALSGSGVSP